MLVEAVALDVPTFVRSVPSFDGVPAALQMTSADDVADASACVQNGARARENVALWSTVLQDNTVEAQGRALGQVYLR
jgi:hypothetical protein